MVVVAMVGILSSLSISSYNRYQAKAKQAEPKLALSSQYTLQKAFYSEYGAYIGSFDAIGYTPEGYKRFYATGWAVCQNPGTISGFNGTIGTCWYGRQNVPPSWNTTVYGGGAYNQASFAGNNPLPTDVDPQIFLLYSLGQIRYGATEIDGWWIRNTKRLENYQNGLE